MSNLNSCIFHFSSNFFIPNVISLVLLSALHLRNIGHQTIQPQPIPRKMEIRTSNSSTEICRICRFGDNEPCLLMDCPCKCTGSIGKVHENCLTQWMRFRNEDWCEICKDKFIWSKNSDSKSGWELGWIRSKRLFRWPYLGIFVKRKLQIISIWPIYNFNLVKMQDFLSIDRCNQGRSRLPTIFVMIVFHTFTASYGGWTIICLFKWLESIGKWWVDVGDEDTEYLVDAE